MLYKIKGNGISCRFRGVKSILYYVIWGGDILNNGYRSTESFPCCTLKEFRDSIEVYVRTYIYEQY